MRLLLDINVVLDVVLARSPWGREASRLLGEIELGRATGFLAGHTVTTVHYVAEKNLGRQATRAAILELLRILEIVPVEKADLYQAAALGWKDFEDAVQAVCALKVDAQYVVTRDEKDFEGFSIPARPAGALLSLL